MSGWTKITVGDVTLKHSSTASVIELIVEDQDGKDSVWLDYYQFEQLKKAIKNTQPDHYEQSKPSK